MDKSIEYRSFRDFYPDYLREHQDSHCRRLHFVGTVGVIAMVLFTVISGWWWGFLLVPVIGYGFAWLGHFVFEKNKPATFIHPWYSLLGDWVMFKDMLIGKVKW